MSNLSVSFTSQSRQKGNSSVAIQLLFLHPGCNSLSLSEPTSRHRKPKACKCNQAGTDGRTLSPSPPSMGADPSDPLEYRAT